MELQQEPLTTPEGVEPEAASTTAQQEKPTPMTKEEILERLQAIAAGDAADIVRDEVNRLRVQFRTIRHDETAAEKAAFIADGNDEAAFEPQADPGEELFASACNTIKEKKAALIAEQELIKAENLAKKDAIIDEINSAADDADNVHRHLERVRELQIKFKEIGEVPAPQVSDQWKRYQLATEKFYDQLKVNKDLRDLDFRKNLESKTLICEEAARLTEEPDIVVAFRRLQDLHNKWREIGPVAKEMREEIWTRFKDLSAEINKKYQAFFEERKAAERANEDAKNAIIAETEAIKTDELTGFAAWDEATAKVLDAQARWKTLGFASHKTNAQLFARFRALCDQFFAAKAAYYKSVKEDLGNNLAKKISICEQAEELRDSTDWKKTADTLIELQNRWKTIGAVPRKQSDALWARFRAACDHFFENKKQNGNDQRRTEQANLARKREIIAALAAITPDSETAANRPEAIKLVRSLMSQYQGVGHVPFRDKDKIHDAYRAEVSRLHDQLDMSATKAAMAAFENSVNELGDNTQELSRQKERLVRSLEMKKNEIKTFENNLGFFNSRSKSGEAMVRDMERRIARLRDEQNNIEQKIALVNAKLNAR